MNATQQTVVSFSRKSTDKRRMLKFRQIGANKYRNRFLENGSIDKAEITMLQNSIVSETQHNPFVVALDKANSKENGEVFELVSGFRRYMATERAISGNVDTARFHDLMDVEVIEMVQGKDQTDDDFHKECRLRSAAENELYVPLTDDERRDFIAACIADEVPEARVMIALGIGQSTYDRYVVVVNNTWMWDHVQQKHIAATTAADLLTAAMHKDTERGKRQLANLQAKMQEIVAQVTEKIEKEQHEFEQTDRTYPPRLLEVRNHPEIRNLAKVWMEQFEAEKEAAALASDLHQAAGAIITIDSKKGEIIFPRKRKIADLTPEQIEALIGSFGEVGERLVPILEVKKHELAIKSLDRKAKLRDLLNFQKEKREKEEQETQGRDPTTKPPGNTPQPKSLKDMIASGTTTAALTKPSGDSTKSDDQSKE